MVQSRKAMTAGFFGAAALLYVYGVLVTAHIPADVAAVALPLDFMVGIPACFYLLVVRPRALTPLAVIPVIWLGFGLSLDDPQGFLRALSPEV